MKLNLIYDLKEMMVSKK